MEKKLYFSIFDENGKEIKCRIIKTFILTKTKKHYMIYTDNTVDDNGVLNCYPAIYDPNDESVFEEVRSDLEWEEIKKVMRF